MKLKDNFKRQIEILGLTLDSHVTKSDLEDLYECGTATIERDLVELRSLGVDIHSTRKDGLSVIGSMAPAILRDLVTDYLVLSHSAESYDKASALLIESKHRGAVSLIVRIQQAIERSQMITIDYQKDIDTVEKNREIAPLFIFQKEYSWRLLALHEGTQKQYILAKILSVRSGTKKFDKPPKEEIEKLFRYSFRSWLSSDEHTIRLALSKSWGEAIQLKPIMEQQNLIRQPDGSFILEGIVSSLGEFASWVVSRGQGVTVLSPKPLRDRVVMLAKAALENYNPQRRKAARRKNG